ncbi:MAG: hypothetical protein IPJ03_16015 [Ignavibacteriales bacterium]|nr:hypothetical protein [Ignavibacteriales bacterium]
MKTRRESTVVKYLSFLEALEVRKETTSIQSLLEGFAVSRATTTHLKRMGVIDEDGNWIYGGHPTIDTVKSLLDNVSDANRNRDRTKKPVSRLTQLLALYRIRDAFKDWTDKPLHDSVKELRLPTRYTPALLWLGVIETSGGKHRWNPDIAPTEELLVEINEWRKPKRKRESSPTSRLELEIKVLSEKIDKLINLWVK